MSSTVSFLADKNLLGDSQSQRFNSAKPSNARLMSSKMAQNANQNQVLDYNRMRRANSAYFPNMALQRQNRQVVYENVASYNLSNSGNHIEHFSSNGNERKREVERVMPKNVNIYR